MFGQNTPKQPSRRQIERRIKELRDELEPHYADYRELIERYKSRDVPKWEYAQRRDVGHEELQRLGALGWELVGVTSYSVTTQRSYGPSAQVDTVYVMYVFKRPYKSVPDDVREQARARIPDIARIEAQIEELESQLDERF